MVNEFNRRFKFVFCWSLKWYRLLVGYCAVSKPRNPAMTIVDPRGLKCRCHQIYQMAGNPVRKNKVSRWALLSQALHVVGEKAKRHCRWSKPLNDAILEASHGRHETIVPQTHRRQARWRQRRGSRRNNRNFAPTSARPSGCC
jgi:hypothetical protein